MLQLELLMCSTIESRACFEFPSSIAKKCYKVSYLCDIALNFIPPSMLNDSRARDRDYRVLRVINGILSHGIKNRNRGNRVMNGKKSKLDLKLLDSM